jgi:hypothetical protein
LQFRAAVLQILVEIASVIMATARADQASHLQAATTAQAADETSHLQATALAPADQADMVSQEASNSRRTRLSPLRST